MLAALAYARNPPGIWFFNPSKWVEQHMFKSASVWDIPLVKPRFSCMVDMSLAGRGYDLGLALRQMLTHFKGALLLSSCMHMHFLRVPPAAPLLFCISLKFFRY